MEKIKKRSLNIALVLGFVLFLFTFITQTFALRQAACYFCDNNKCLQASGSGWSGCTTGNESCGFYGSSCGS
ncbi:MAG: hypothetical protein IPM32_09140 [Ignavibacteriae bacterium]|nr:hypothetical protein [Ignavibacteriota bacterium]